MVRLAVPWSKDHIDQRVRPSITEIQIVTTHPLDSTRSSAPHPLPGRWCSWQPSCKRWRSWPDAVVSKAGRTEDRHPRPADAARESQPRANQRGSHLGRVLVPLRRSEPLDSRTGAGCVRQTIASRTGSVELLSLPGFHSNGSAPADSREVRAAHSPRPRAPTEMHDENSSSCCAPQVNGRHPGDQTDLGEPSTSHPRALCRHCPTRSTASEIYLSGSCDIFTGTAQ